MSTEKKEGISTLLAMEVVQQWVHEEAEEVGEEVVLQGRQHRQHSQSTTASTTVVATASTTAVATDTPAPNGVKFSERDGVLLESGAVFDKDKDRGTY